MEGGGGLKWVVGGGRGGPSETFVAHGILRG